MKIQKVNQNINQNQKDSIGFKNGAAAFLRYLATNQAVGANVVDVTFMVIPRTASDTIRRGPVAGLETGRREASGTANHTLVGVYGIGAGALVAAVMGIDRKYGTKSNQIMTAPETLNILAENKAAQLAQNKTQADYLRQTLKEIKAFNPASKNADKDGFVKLSKETIDDVVKILDNVISDKSMNFKKWTKSKVHNSIDVVANLITADTGAQTKYILESAAETGSKQISETNLKTLLEDIYKVSEAFNKEKVKDAFEAQLKSGKGIKDNAFIKRLSKFKNIKSIAGFAIASGVGMSIQPLNMYMTKKKTGQDGFVGVEGRSKDDSLGFKLLKGTSAAAFFAMVLATLDTGLKGFMDKMAFKGFWPTISQLKGVYGLTIISRLFAARDKDELRESLTKDTLGFLSWLVLGDFVNKMTAEAMDKRLDKTVMNRTKEVAEKGFLARVFKSSLKNRDEILIETLAEHGIETVKKDGDKVVAKRFKELMHDLERLPENVKKSTKKRLNVLNRAQLAGYLFSGLVLGLGIPNLNIYITNKLDRKRKAAAAEAEAKKAADAA